MRLTKTRLTKAALWALLIIAVVGLYYVTEQADYAMLLLFFGLVALLFNTKETFLLAGILWATCAALYLLGNYELYEQLGDYVFLSLFGGVAKYSYTIYSGHKQKLQTAEKGK